MREIAGLGSTKSEITKEVNVLTVVGGVEVEVGAVVAVPLRVAAEAETTAGVGAAVGYVPLHL